jgi:hypothetical protein
VTDNHGMRFKFKVRFSGTSNKIIRMKEGRIRRYAIPVYEPVDPLSG